MSLGLASLERLSSKPLLRRSAAGPLLRWFCLPYSILWSQTSDKGKAGERSLAFPLCL